MPKKLRRQIPVSRRGALQGLGALGVLAAGGSTRALWAAPAASSLAPAGALSFRVTRKGDQIGHQEIDFARQGHRLSVRSRIDIKVTLLGIAVFVFRHQVQEIWQADRLVELISATDDDGTPHQVHALSAGASLRIEADGHTSEAPGDVMPSSMWNPETVHRTMILDSIKGLIGAVAIADRGEETLTIRGAPVSAHHYAVTGAVVREIWYGPDLALCQFRSPGKDGSIVTFERV